MDGAYELPPTYDTSPCNSTTHSLRLTTSRLESNLAECSNSSFSIAASSHLDSSDFTPSMEHDDRNNTSLTAKHVPSFFENPIDVASRDFGSKDVSRSSFVPLHSSSETHHLNPTPKELKVTEHQEESESSVIDVLSHQMIRSLANIDSAAPCRVRKLTINTSFSIKKMHDVFSHFGSEKRALLDTIGLGTLFKVQKQRLQCRDLLLHLLSNMNPDTGTIVLKSGELTCEDKDVNFVLGIPYKGEDVTLSSTCPASVEKVKAILGLQTNREITVDDLHDILVKDYGRRMSMHERDAFKVAAILFVDSCFLGPRGCNKRINKDILNHVTSSSKICNTNWASYVLEVLRQSASKVQQTLTTDNKTVVLDGCLLFLLVFYLDNLNFGYMTPRHDIVPRIFQYTPSLISELLSYDRVSNVTHQRIQYGRRNLRPSDEVIYSRRGGATPKECPKTSKHYDLQISNGAKKNPSTSDTFLDRRKNQRKGDKDLMSFEGREAYAEYMNVFRNRIHQSIDELERNIGLLLSTSRPDIYSPSFSRKGTNGYRNSTEHQSITASNLGLKAPSRKYYMTVQSSSISGSKNQSTSTMCTVGLIQRPMKNCSPSQNLCHSFDLVAEGCARESMPHEILTNLSDVCNDNSLPHHTSRPSPFVLELRHMNVSLRKIMDVLRILPKLTDDDLKMDWFIHDVPSRLVIDGGSLYACLYNDKDFTTATMNAVMRLYHELEDHMYIGCHEKRWRHFLPADWAAQVMLENSLDGNSLLKDYFVGEHIGFKVTECRMVFVPVYNNDHWSLYAWDFSDKTITIMDPDIQNMGMQCPNHEYMIARLHRAMFFCYQQYLDWCGSNNETWEQKYFTEKSDCCSMYNSGIFTVFCAQFFDGTTCTRGMAMEDSVTLFQTSLLCQLLVSASNKGSYPGQINEAIAEIM